MKLKNLFKAIALTLILALTGTVLVFGSNFKTNAEAWCGPPIDEPAPPEQTLPHFSHVYYISDTFDTTYSEYDITNMIANVHGVYDPSIFINHKHYNREYFFISLIAWQIDFFSITDSLVIIELRTIMPCELHRWIPGLFQHLYHTNNKVMFISHIIK